VRYDTLLTCPLNTPVTVQRVSDQDPEFLRFVERHDLRPGQVIEVEERNDAADSVRLRGGKNHPYTIGARAASKVLVHAAAVIAMLVLLGTPARAQTAPATPVSAPAETDNPFKIADNSFLVEEAFNQERGIFQNIFGAVRSGGQWASSFTQEWPAPSMTHQLSYTLSFADGGSGFGAGDTLINYRYQALEEGPGRPAFSPRASLVLPTGSVSEARGNGSYGLQVNLPVSKRRGAIYWHGNAGFTWLPRAEATGSSERANLLSPFVAGSTIYALRPMFHLMLEQVLVFDQSYDGVERSRNTSYTLSPGVRGGWNLGEAQLVGGVALPITWESGESNTGVFFYLSYELPFTRK